MGFNLVRWLSDSQYRALRRWRAVRGDDTLRLAYDLNPLSIVIDGGAYQGDFSARISERFGSTIYAFEPVPQFARQIREREFASSVTILEYGLSDRDHEGEVALAADATSSFGSGQSLRVRFRDAVLMIEELAPQGVDLMKLNVEGGEYAVLERLISAGHISRIADIQVQFHLLKAGDKTRYRHVAELLARTHDLTWRFPFVWENWRLR